MKHIGKFHSQDLSSEKVKLSPINANEVFGGEKDTVPTHS
jgi:hypothetical protein